MAFSKDKETEDVIDSSNIFDEFENNQDLKEEISEIKEKKDNIYYISKLWSVFQSMFWLILFFSIFAYFYISFQENEDQFKNQSFNSVCPLLIFNIPNIYDGCSSIYWLNKDYKIQLNKTKKDIVDNIVSISKDLYENNNFYRSKEILFLLENSENKLQTINILNSFSTLRKEYSPLDLDKIKCDNIKISNNNVFTASCVAYSYPFENNIKWFNWENNSRTKWTSISRAVSFLNYIELKYPDFSVIDKQKSFTSEKITNKDTWFTNQTKFNLKLLYSPRNIY